MCDSEKVGRRCRGTLSIYAYAPASGKELEGSNPIQAFGIEKCTT
jgi:hypothetical protein